MKTVLLPVKDFKNAKQRLAGSLNSDERSRLAWAMYSDVLIALAGCRELDRVVVYTASDDAALMAQLRGFEVVAEESVKGHSAAVNHMLERLSANASLILSIASDLPKLTSGEIDFVISNVCDPFTILPSRDGTGTNGLVFMGPARILVEYGEGSFRRHLSKARAAGLSAGVLNLPGVAFDIDTPEDLSHFMSDPPRSSKTWKYLSDLHR